MAKTSLQVTRRPLIHFAFTFLELNIPSPKKGREIRLLFTFSTEISRGSHVPKSVLHEQNCCFATLGNILGGVTQHCNVGAMLQPFESMSQQCCNAVLR